MKTSSFRSALTYYKLSILLQLKSKSNIKAILNTPKVLVAYPAVLTNKEASIKNTVDEVLKNYLKQN